MTPMVNLAFTTAILAHEGQKRRDGRPYIVHPIRVAERLAAWGESEKVIAVGLLHDAAEDSDVNIPDTEFPIDVIAAVNALTKVDGESYSAYIERVKANPIARKVKIADILDNISDSPTDHQIHKYSAALLILV